MNGSSADEISTRAPILRRRAGISARSTLVISLLLLVTIAFALLSTRKSRRGGIFSSMERDGHTILYCYDGRNREFKWIIVFDRIIGPFVKAKGGFAFQQTTGCVCHANLTMIDGRKIVIIPSDDGRHLTVGNDRFDVTSGQVFLYGWNSDGEPVVVKLYDRKLLELLRNVRYEDVETVVARSVAPIVGVPEKKKETDE